MCRNYMARINFDNRLAGFMSAIRENDGILQLPARDIAGDTMADRGKVTVQDCNDGSVIYILNEADEHGC